ncbi:FecCD family ABC transporter permease [Paenibacillus sp. 481]|uniref:FecCD family ABC transporter permease n=1 Tax=Paenibacillus sp. 481 TaxID=2835869 RepID=UPI001E4A3E0A|nr:iron ABC transporter permease [Paenibacillus sp. 481]UHA75587.1 iron ABC transporter permease [Paenibacillus sp. 481]
MTIHKRRSIPFGYKLFAGFLSLVAIFALAMVVGAADTSIQEVWLALTTQAVGDSMSIIREIRLPREIAAIVVGAALAIAGAIMQGMTRNPLADPGLLGLTAGAHAALAIALAWLPTANYITIIVACFIGAGVGATMVLGIVSIKKGNMSPFRIVLAGAAVTALLNAIAEAIGIYFKLSKDVSMWTSGGLVGTSWKQLEFIVPFIIVGIVIALLLSKQLTILSLSDEVAVGLGQNTKLVKAILFIVIILLAGASVALVGNMIFIGLMIPHIARALVGTDYRFIVPMSAILGANFMLFADMLGRTMNIPYETPVASIVAMMGLPFFLFIVHKGGKSLS